MTTQLYLGGAVVLVLLIVLIMQMCQDNYAESSGVIVETSIGLIKANPNSIMNELQYIKKMLKDNLAGAQSSCKDLSPQIKLAMRNISNFIKANPAGRTKAICDLELSADIVNQQLVLSNTPNDRDVQNSYNSILEQERQEREMPTDPYELMKYLITNIDVTIHLLRFDLCQSGVLNIKKLYSILQEMNAKLCQTGKDHDKTDFNASIYTSEFPRYSMNLGRYTTYNNPPALPLFIKDAPYIEPFQGRRNTTRSSGKYSLSSPLKKYEIYDEFNVQDVYTPACDETIEGSMGCDALGYKPPGHIISSLYDKSDHYTVNVNSCASNSTNPRETANCHLEDMKLLDAINGHPKQMLDCIGDCSKEPNYFRWYHQLNTATKDMEFILNTEQ